MLDIFKAIESANEAADITTTQDGDSRRRITRKSDGCILGWITTWLESDKVNHTGIKRFSAAPFGVGIAKHNCETFSSAVAYLKGYAEQG